MAEKVQTGGLMQFKYSKEENAKLDDERKNAISKGYEDYYKRKANEKRNKIIMWVVIGLIILGIAFSYLYFTI